MVMVRDCRLDKGSGLVILRMELAALTIYNLYFDRFDIRTLLLDGY